MLLGTLCASLLGKILTGKGAITTSQGRGVNRAGEGAIAKSISEETKLKRQGRRIVRAGYGNKIKFKKQKKKNKKNLMQPHSLTIFDFVNILLLLTILVSH